MRKNQYRLTHHRAGRCHPRPICPKCGRLSDMWAVGRRTRALVCSTCNMFIAEGPSGKVEITNPPESGPLIGGRVYPLGYPITVE